MGKRSKQGSYKVSVYQGFYLRPDGREFVTAEMRVTDAYDNRWSLLAYTKGLGWYVGTAFEAGNQPRGGMAFCKAVPGASYEEALANGIQEFWARSPMSLALTQYRGLGFTTASRVVTDDEEEVE